MKLIHKITLSFCFVISFIVVSCNSSPVIPTETAATNLPTLQKMATPAPTPSPATPTSQVTDKPSPIPLPAEEADANGDGVVDQNDALYLFRKGIALWDKDVKPLLEKAGIETDKNGHITTSDAKTKIHERLTDAEESVLYDALKEFQEISAKAEAILKGAFRSE